MVVEPTGGPRVRIVPGGARAAGTKKAGPARPSEAASAAVGLHIERLREAAIRQGLGITNAAKNLTWEQAKKMGFNREGFLFFSAGGVEGGTADDTITPAELKAAMAVLIQRDTIRALTGGAQTGQAVSIQIARDFKTAKSIRWVACEDAAREYANKYSSNFEGGNLKLDQWLKNDCNEEIRGAARTIAERLNGSTVDNGTRFTVQQFTSLLYALAFAAHSADPSKYGLKDAAKAGKPESDKLLAWVSKEGKKAAGREEASGAGTSDSSASGVAAGDKKITEGEKYFDLKGRLKPGADLSAVVKLYKEALDEYKKDINSGDTEIRKHAKNNTMVAASRLLRYDTKNSPQYLQEISNIYRANIKDSPDDLDSKARLVDIILMQASAKQERALNKSIPEQLKTDFENEAAAFIEEARAMARTTEKDLLKKVGEAQSKLNEISKKVAGQREGKDKLVDELAGLEQKLKQIQESLNGKIPLPGQLKFEMALQDKGAPMENDVKAHDNFVLELGESLLTSTLEKADKFRIHLQLAQTEIRRGNYEKVKEHCQKALTFYDTADKGLKEKAKTEIKEIIEQMCQFHDKKLVGYAKEMVDTLDQKELLVGLAIKYKAFKRKGGKTLAETEEISINRPADMSSVLRDSYVPLKSEIVIEYLLAVKSGNFDEIRPETLARLAEKKQDTPQKREEIRLLQKKRFLLRVAYILINDKDYKELVKKEPKLNMGKDWSVAQRLNWLQTVVKKDYNEAKKSELSKGEKKAKKH